MLMNIRSLSLIALVSIIMGCGGSSSLVKDAPDQHIENPGKNNSQIVFVRDAFVLNAVPAKLFEVTGGNIKFIGALPNGKKIVYKTNPGKKVFMAYGETMALGYGKAADFMKADIVGGKTYYSKIMPHFAWGASGFCPMPIRKYEINSKEFKNFLNGTKLIMTDETEAQEWYKNNKEHIKDVYTAYWKEFQTKNEVQQAESTLMPEDGVGN